MNDARYMLDGEAIDLAEFIRDNAEGLDEETLADVAALQPGEEIVFGGGAAPIFVLRCEATVTEDRSCSWCGSFVGDRDEHGRCRRCRPAIDESVEGKVSLLRAVLKAR